MFGFKKRVPLFEGKSKNEQMLASMKNAVQQQKKSVPYEPYIFTGRALSDLVLDAIADEPAHGVDTALCIVGSMAGYSAAVAAREAFLNMDRSQVLDGDYVKATAPDGTQRFSGSLVNEALISGRNAFWRLVDAKGKALMGVPMSGLADINSYADDTILTPEFGQPRMPEGTKCLERPDVLIQYLWPEFYATLTSRSDDAAGWCMSWGFAAQDVLDEACGEIGCPDAMRIMMECAIPMSRIDPDLMIETQVAA